MIVTRHLSILIYGFLIFGFSGCATTRSERAKTGPPAPTDSATTAAVKSPEPEIPQIADLPLPDGEWKAVARDFREDLAKWVEKSATATYAKVAKEAQKYVSTMGLIYHVDVKNLPAKYKGYKTLTLPDGHNLNFSTANAFEGACGESFVKVSVMGFRNGLPIILTTDGAKEVKGLMLEKTLVRRSERESAGALIYRPNAEAPWNVSPDAQSIIWQYDLKQSLLFKWWQKLARRYRELREERPYLVIRISEDNFVVETKDKSLLPAAYEQVNPQQKDDPYLIRRLYKPRGIAVDFEGPCT